MDKNSSVPKHIAVIMDGNGRWAKKRMQPRMFGHRAGMKALHETVQAASDMGIKYLSVYAFSTENWKRSEDEVGGLMNLAVEYFFKEIEELNEKNVRVLVLGDTDGLPVKVQEAAANAEKLTAANTGLTLNVLLNYGGRDEMIRAFRQLEEEGVQPENIDEQMISDHLYTAGQPDPDILIRTSGEKRLSNMMLWQISYAEIFFVDTLWPDFGRKDLEAILEEYSRRDRRFGNA
ncbi:MAG: isoprenyl transferase [Eubacteriaceae bacterium]|jgi:undecaprenyl diphosphate synthase